jgi:hypothetical protein
MTGAHLREQPGLVLVQAVSQGAGSAHHAVGHGPQDPYRSYQYFPNHRDK